MTIIHFLGKNIYCQHATRRTTNEIWITIMIIGWWYSNKFLSLPIILFSFYSIFFTCLPVSPYGDYLPAGDSVSFIPFYLLAFQCLHAVIICLPDMDRTSVLVPSGRCWQPVCFSCREEKRYTLIYSLHFKLFIIPGMLESQRILRLIKILERIKKTYDIK